MPSIQSRILLIQDEAFPRLLSKGTETCQGRGFSPRARVVLLVAAAILVIMLMVMLLLWNYKCIVIDHLCQGIKEPETFIFTNEQSVDGTKPVI